MTPSKDLWDIIVIVIALNFLSKDFDTTIASLLKTGDKTIDQIQNILQSKEVKNLSKRGTGAIGDLAILFCNHDWNRKRKVNTNNKYYNCHKLGHFGQNYFFSRQKIE